MAREKHQVGEVNCERQTNLEDNKRTSKATENIQKRIDCSHARTCKSKMECRMLEMRKGQHRSRESPLVPASSHPPALRS
jgi:hypothetical protein